MAVYPADWPWFADEPPDLCSSMGAAESQPGDTARDPRAAPFALHDAMESLARLSAASRLYGIDHASVMSAVTAAAGLFRGTDASSWPVMLAVAGGGFMSGDRPLGTGPASTELAAALRECGIAAIEWLRAPTAPELASIAAWIGTLPGARRETPPPCASGDGACLRIVRIGAGSLRFVGHEAGTTDGQHAGWETLCRALADGATSAGAGATVEDVRERLAVCGPQERAGAEEVLLVAQGGEGAHSQRSGRAVEALSRLSPELRRSLLAVCATGNAEWVSGQCDALPVEDLVESLRTIDRQGHVPPPATLLLLKKLVGLTKLTASDRGSLVSLAAKWSGGDEPLTRLMTGHGADMSCPEDYERDLRSVTEGVRTATAPPFSPGDFDDNAVAARTCKIILDVLPSPDTCDRAGSYFNALDRLLPIVARAGRADIVLRAAITVGHVAASGDPDMADAGARCMNGIGGAKVLGETLHRLGTDDASISLLAGLVSAAPVRVASVLAGRLGAGEIAPDHAHVRCASALISPAALREAVGATLAQGPAACSGVVRLLSACTGERALLGAEPLLASQDTILRAGVLRMLDRCATEWPPRLMHLALTHPDSAVIEIGLARLVHNPGVCSPDMLGSLIDGSLTGSVPDERAAGAIAVAMVSRGEAGIDRAAEALGALSRGVHLQRIEVCRLLARALRPHATRPAVAGALRAWRRSAGGMVAWLFAEDSARRAA